jgi:hypothetical protein
VVDHADGSAKLATIRSVDTEDGLAAGTADAPALGLVIELVGAVEDLHGSRSME